MTQNHITNVSKRGALGLLGFADLKDDDKAKVTQKFGWPTVARAAEVQTARTFPETPHVEETRCELASLRRRCVMTEVWTGTALQLPGGTTQRRRGRKLPKRWYRRV